MTDFPEKCLRKIPFVLLTEDNKSSVAQREHFFEYQEFAFENYYDLKNIKLLFSEDEYLVFSILLSHDKKNGKTYIQTQYQMKIEIISISI
ncbi:hypothetical protein APA03_17932 [Acetobacter pasteurianus IFO 3283-03]|uniref:hypothetical protein n=1 Tax=Acetobacter pasteurianus TaxID=438 RepID=UPI0001B5C3A6|nr:hypothetical protein [Acetobacter pasteurianus]BAI02971.1 hypothetical protein APA03_17932 [Acetobacter pasteurianus IFO 3283-03]